MQVNGAFCLWGEVGQAGKTADRFLFRGSGGMPLKQSVQCERSKTSCPPSEQLPPGFNHDAFLGQVHFCSVYFSKVSSRLSISFATIVSAANLGLARSASVTDAPVFSSFEASSDADV